MPANRSRTLQWRRCLQQIHERNGALELAVAREYGEGQEGSHLVWRVRVLELRSNEIVVEQPMALPVLEPGYRVVAKELFNVDFDAIDDVVYISDYSILIDLVSQGDFVTAGPMFAFRRDVEAGRIAVAALDQRVNYQLHIVRRHQPISLPILTRVEERIRAIIH